MDLQLFSKHFSRSETAVAWARVNMYFVSLRLLRHFAGKRIQLFVLNITVDCSTKLGSNGVYTVKYNIAIDERLATLKTENFQREEVRMFLEVYL